MSTQFNTTQFEKFHAYHTVRVIINSICPGTLWSHIKKMSHAAQRMQTSVTLGGQNAVLSNRLQNSQNLFDKSTTKLT